MKRCPACNAKYTEGQYCRRCGMDIGSLLNIKKKAEEYKQKAIDAFINGSSKEMHEYAKKCVSLLKSPANMKILACSALLNKKFKKSIYLWREL
ncbi:MAG: hypothetical protein HQK76_11575 [Desulfobacterales bacterium]|nr:hypothetical protein [Desulfobacterales bacterium]